METPGNPVVYGEIAGVRDDITVVLYNHYDVKPIEPLGRLAFGAFSADVSPWPCGRRRPVGAGLAGLD